MKKQLFALCFCALAQQAGAQVVINELCTRNGNGITDFQLQEENWVELYNAGAAPVALAGYGLSDNNTGPEFIFPPFTINPGQFKLIFLSGKNLTTPEWHTPFKIKEGESVYLYNAAGTVADQLTPGELHLDHSKGRHPDGSTNVYYFDAPSPGSSNNPATTYAGYTAAPQCSKTGGFYNGSVQVNMTSATPSAVIRYSTNGDLPGVTAAVWTTPCNFTTSKVLRARAFAPGLLPSAVNTQSYFVNVSHDLPVLHVITDSVVFFDTITGLFHNGNHLSDTEYLGMFQYFVDEELVFSQDLGLSIHGGSVNRAQAMKSIRLSARKRYGKNEMEYPFFDTRDYTQCRQLVLRNGSSDFCHTQMRDELATGSLLNTTHNDVLANRPCVVYINGNYWGLYNLREKRGRHNLAEVHGVNEDSLDILRDNLVVWKGDTMAFHQMYQYVLDHDLSNDEHFAAFAGMMDMNNFADYFIGEAFYGNFDWPFNNIECWRERKAGSKFRYMLFDMDVAFIGTPWENQHYNLWAKMQSTYCDSNYHINMLERSLTNQQYYNYFVNRYCDLLNTIFTPQRLASLAQVQSRLIESEVPVHFLRWGVDPAVWAFEMEKVHLHNRERPAIELLHLQGALQPGNIAAITTKVEPSEAGSIGLNTIQVDEALWFGNYFDHVPVKLKPLAKEGYRFKAWKVEQAGTVNFYPEEELTVTLIDGAVVTAVYGDDRVESMLVFPNPAVGNATLRIFNGHGEALEVDVVDATGRNVYATTLAGGQLVNDVSLDLRTYEPGVYTARAKGKEETMMVKFICQ